MVSWAKSSVILISASFVTLVLFIVLSSPITTIFSMINDESEKIGVEGDVSPILTTYSTVFGMVFTLAMISIGVYFLLGSHSEEFDYPERRRWE